MPKARDITGQRFGRLVALEFVGTQRCNSKKAPQTKRVWRFRCDCGNIIERRSNLVIRGDTQSCGCLKRELMLGHVAANTLPFGESSARGLFSRYKYTSRKRGLEWRLSYEKFKSIVEAQCAYCGTVPEQVFISNQSSNGPLVYNGIDRVNNDVGYISNNVVSCCARCNRAKGTQTLVEFTEWLDRIVEFRSR